jgi:hypothetical protein
MIDKEYLAEQLKKPTFDAIKYFTVIPVGCYQVSKEVFYDITQHPSLRHYYRVRAALQQGESVLGINPAEYYTIFKSISRDHMEFDSGVVIVKEVD